MHAEESSYSELSSQIIAAEKRRCEAQVAKDFDTLDDLISEDLIYTHSNSIVDTKSSYIAALKSGKFKYERMDHENVHVRIYHGLLAVLTGRMRVAARVDGGDLNVLTLLFTEMWTRPDLASRNWQMTTWQSTAVANP